MRSDPPASISIVVPCYRSGPWIEELVERIDRATGELKGRRELVLVDDASPDDVTWPALSAVAARLDWVRAIGLQYNVGQFRATLAGMARTDGDWVVTLDDDLQTPPEEITKLIAAAAAHPEMDAIIGAYADKQHSALRNLGTRFVSFLYRRLFRKPRGLQTTSFRILRKRLVRVLCSHGTRRPQLGALILQSTTPGRCMNVPVAHEPRREGESGYSFGTLANLALDNVFVASTVPLRAMSALGLLVASGSFVLSFFYLLRWAFGYIQEPGFTTLVLLLTFASGMVLLSIGVVGEYVQRVVTEVTGQPHHVVREEVASTPIAHAPLADTVSIPATGSRQATGARRGQRLLVLGASGLQVPLVQTALGMGLEVVTADNVPSNPAHRWASRSLNVSTRDAASLVAHARDLEIDGVVTAASDVAVPSVASLIEALGLPGSVGRASEIFTDKEAFRRFQREAGLGTPDGVCGAAVEELVEKARAELTGPVVVKPVDRSGSRGVRFVDDVAAEELPALVRDALAESFAGRARIEARVEGLDYGGDAVIRDGRVLAYFATRKRLEGTAVRGHVLPSGLGPDGENALRCELQAHVDAIGLRDGVLDLDARMRPDGVPVMIEMSPRVGGNWIPELVAYTTGLDLFRYAIELALGREPEPPPTGAPRASAAVHTLGSPVDGKIERLPTLAELRQRIPGLVRIEFDCAVGDSVCRFKDSSNQVGRALTDAGDPAATAEQLDAAFAECLAP